MLIIDKNGTIERELHGRELVVYLKTWPVFADASADRLAFAVWLLEDAQDFPWIRLRTLFGGNRRSDGERIPTRSMVDFPLQSANGPIWQIDDDRGFTVLYPDTFAVVPWPEATLETWDVLTVDAWGNEEEGYEVNNLMRSGVIAVFDDISHEDFILALIEEGHLRPGDESQEDRGYKLDDFGEGAISVESADTSEPFLQLHRRELPFRAGPVDENISHEALFAAVLLLREESPEERFPSFRHQRSQEGAPSTDPGLVWRVVWDSGVDAGAFSEEFATEEEALRYGENWAREMNFLDRTEGHDNDDNDTPYSFELVQRPSTAVEQSTVSRRCDCLERSDSETEAHDLNCEAGVPFFPPPSWTQARRAHLTARTPPAGAFRFGRYDFSLEDIAIALTEAGHYNEADWLAAQAEDMSQDAALVAAIRTEAQQALALNEDEIGGYDEMSALISAVRYLSHRDDVQLPLLPLLPGFVQALRTDSQPTTAVITQVAEDGAQWGWPGERVVRYLAADGSWAWIPGSGNVGDRIDL
jgi:hypothetical protein